MLGLAGIFVFAHSHTVFAQKKSTQGRPASLVHVDAVKEQVLSQTVPIIGRLVAKRAGDVSTRIDGYIDHYKVDVGDTVEKGDVIAVLNSDVLKEQLALAKSEAVQAQARLNAAQARAQLARQSLNRYTSLRNSPAYSRSRVEDQRQSLKEAVANISEARATIDAKKASQKVRSFEIEYTNIRAPFSGAITRKNLSAGSYARTGEALVHLISDKALEIEADVPYQRVVGLTPGIEVSFSLDDGTRHIAKVRAVIPAENPTTRTRIVRFVPEFNGTKTSLANAQTAKLEVPLSSERKVMTVHKDAILQRGGGAVVFVMLEGKAVQKRVKLDESIGSRVEVVSGLQAGDLAIVRGNERLSPGVPVRANTTKPQADKKSAGAKK